MKEYWEAKGKIEIRHYVSHPENEDVITIANSETGESVVLNGDDAKKLIAILNNYSN